MTMEEFKEKSEKIFEQLDTANKEFEKLEKKYDSKQLNYKEYQESWKKIWKKKLKLEEKLKELTENGFEFGKINEDFTKKSTRTEKHLIEIIEKARENDEILTAVELAKRSNISRQAIYKSHKHILDLL